MEMSIKIVIYSIQILFFLSCIVNPFEAEKERQKERDKKTQESCLIEIIFYIQCYNSQPSGWTEQQKEMQCGRNPSVSPCIGSGSF